MATHTHTHTHTPSSSIHVCIVGAGLCGSMMALILAQRGVSLTLYEKRSDIRVEWRAQMEEERKAKEQREHVCVCVCVLCVCVYVCMCVV